jgi:hypothetical protein
MFDVEQIIPKFRENFESSLKEPAIESKVGDFFDAAKSDPVDVAEEFVRNCYIKAVKHNLDVEVTPEHLAVEAENSLDAYQQEQKKMDETGRCAEISSIPRKYDVAAYPDVEIKGAEGRDNLFRYEKTAEAFTHACQSSLRQIERQQEAEKIAAIQRQGRSR